MFRCAAHQPGEKYVGLEGSHRKEDRMARISYGCSLAGEEVQVLVEHIILNDQKLGAKRASPELRFCSHVGKGNCPVREADEQSSDVEGFPYSGTDGCEHLQSLGHHD